MKYRGDPKQSDSSENELLIEGQDSLLHEAVKNNATDEVKALLAKKIPGLINHKGYLGYSPLHIAVRENNTEMARLLIDNHADIDIQDNEGSTPLYMASYFLQSPEDAFKFASVLLDNQAKVNIINNITMSTALHPAVKAGNYQLAKLLIAHGADLNIKDNSGKTVLFLAVERGDLPMVKLLIDHGADLCPKNPNLQNPMTALGLAKSVKPKNKDIIKFLEEKMQASKAPDEKSETQEEQLSTSEEQVKTLNFYDKLCGEKSAAELIEFMNWKIHPKIRIKDVKAFATSEDSVIKKGDYNLLIKHPNINRTLFNLGVYSSMLPEGAKKDALNTFLKKLRGKSSEQAEELIQAALTNQTLIKNTGFGFYKFFHHHIVNHEMKDRWARSTTEVLLIDLYNAVKNPAELEVDHSQEDSTGISL